MSYEEVRYEGYAPSGIAVLVECTTDNRNRTVSEVRHAFTKYGGSLGSEGSVAYLFDKVGLLIFPPGMDEDVVMEVAVEAGAQDVETGPDGTVGVITEPEELNFVTDQMSAAGLVSAVVEVVQRPTSETELAGEEAEKVMLLINALEDLDDVQDVFTNASFPEDMVFAS